MNVSIYIKSSFRGNPRGAGEAAAVIEFIDKQGKSHKRQQRTQIEADTKNALHLKICIAAMRVLLKPCDITVFIDCDYMANACRLGWLDKWQQDGWKKARSYMDKPRKEGGDELICNGNYIKVAQIGIEEKKEGGGDNG